MDKFAKFGDIKTLLPPSATVEALRIFDHYHFRVTQTEAKAAGKQLELAKPPRSTGETQWFLDDYTDPRKIRDRELFS